MTADPDRAEARPEDRTLPILGSRQYLAADVGDAPSVGSTAPGACEPPLGRKG